MLKRSFKKPCAFQILNHKSSNHPVLLFCFHQHSVPLAFPCLQVACFVTCLSTKFRTSRCTTRRLVGKYTLHVIDMKYIRFAQNIYIYIYILSRILFTKSEWLFIALAMMLFALGNGKSFDKIVYDKFMYGTLHMQITQVSDLIHSMFLDRVRIIQHRQHHISHTRNQWIPKWIGIMFRLVIILILRGPFFGGQSYHLINATPRLIQGRATGPGASLQHEWLCFWSFSSNCSSINSDLVI